MVNEFNIEDAAKKLDEYSATRMLKDAQRILEDNTSSQVDKLRAYIEVLTAEYSLRNSSDDFWQARFDAANKLLNALVVSQRKAKKDASLASELAYKNTMQKEFRNLSTKIIQEMGVDVTEDGEWDFTLEY